MVNLSTPHGLEGLFDLDRKGVDIRPTLLRVLTDQYLRTPTPTAEEERHYGELAQRLLDQTDIATRAAVSARLAQSAYAPRAIMLQLARDVVEIAEPVLLFWSGLTPADSEVIVAERGTVYADILAKRGKQLPPVAPPIASAVPKTIAEPAPVPAPVVPATALVAPVTAPAAGPETKAYASSQLPVRSLEAESGELCELFFAAGSPERRLILLNLDFCAWFASAPPATLQRADIWRMETAALRHNTATVTNELERVLGISHPLARRIVEDELGEPIVVAAKSMSVPADVLQRILLFMNPKVGQSVDRVYELSALYSEISVEAARRMIAIVRAAEPSRHKPATDTRALYSAVETAQRALSDIASGRRADASRRIARAGEG